MRSRVDGVIKKCIHVKGVGVEEGRGQQGYSIAL